MVEGLNSRNLTLDMSNFMSNKHNIVSNLEQFSTMATPTKTPRKSNYAPTDIR